MKSSARRWWAYAVAGLATAGAMVWVDGPAQDAAGVAVVPARAMPAVPPRAAAVAVAVTNWTLPQRSFSLPAVDLFDDAAPEPAMPALAPPSPPESAAATVAATVPALAYAYVGQWVEKGDAVAFLSTPQGLNVAARVGVTLDGGYRVDAIDEHGMSVTYLPLGVKQHLSFARAPGAAAEPQGAAHPPAAPNEPEEMN